MFGAYVKLSSRRGSPRSRRECVVAQGTWQPDADVYSPDRSVRLRADQSGQLLVDLQGLDRHTDETLAGQVRAAARVALASLQAEQGPDVRGAGGWR